eukprot:774-Rhodomonas_salina.1
MTSSHAKIEEYGMHGVVVQWLWYQAEYGICPVDIVHTMLAQWQGHSLGLPLATRGHPQVHKTQNRQGIAFSYSPDDGQ